MLNEESISKYANKWASDLSIKATTKVEIYDEDVINQSIEMILATTPTSRLFNLAFGSLFSLRLFNNMTQYYLQNVVDDAVSSIERWEDRIVIIKDKVSLIANVDTNTVSLTIPYIIKNRKVAGTFSKVIRQ
jgi:phage baseplate assembly protein W